MLQETVLQGLVVRTNGEIYNVEILTAIVIPRQTKAAFPEPVPELSCPPGRTMLFPVRGTGLNLCCQRRLSLNFLGETHSLS